MGAPEAVNNGYLLARAEVPYSVVVASARHAFRAGRKFWRVFALSGVGCAPSLQAHALPLLAW